MKKLVLALMCIFATQSATALNMNSLLKIAGIVTTTGLLTAVRVENPLLKALLFPASINVHAENQNTERMIDVNVRFNIVPLIVGYWAIKKL